jgi:arylsulfatase A-like enzyme
VRIFTSDNGHTLSHRWKQRKFAVYEESVRVPLLIKGPGYPTQTRGELVANVDLAPTLLALAAATPGRTQDGADLGPLLRGESVPWRSALLLESQHAVASYSAIRTSSHVYVEHASGEQELYDLAADPGQLESKHADPLHAPLKASLAAQLAPLKTCVAAGCWVP